MEMGPLSLFSVTTLLPFAPPTEGPQKHLQAFEHSVPSETPFLR